ncbi:MAG: Rpn family recombination-promoting nuclease/putative transposase [Treponema sp.]|nr:Rpn family recombination-promoting nuclease/putative transposase [Treponema sp.]
MKTNRKFKDSVFTSLFSDPDLLRELYCALENVSLSPETPVSINTLENVLYMDLCNDISFEIGDKLVVLIEHQSTINPNMALRLFLYVSKILEKITRGRALYSDRKISIPRPEFFVLYNGKDPFPDNKTLKLSDLFRKPEDLGLPEPLYPMLELEVKVINITEGKNIEIQNRCSKLSEYSKFIALIHKYLEEYGNLEDATKEAINYCHRHDILVEFLEKHGSGVLGMILTEWNTEDAIAFAREEGREDGFERGVEKGSKHEKQTIARNLLSEGSTLEFTQKITGLDLETIKGLSSAS